VSATQLLELVFKLMPAAFLADFLVFTFGLWWLNRWRKVRNGR
jgi:hypothetical protein